MTESMLLSPRKPRNPLVAHARFRLAGRHAPTSGGQRRQAARDLRREIDRLKPPSP